MRSENIERLYTLAFASDFTCEKSWREVPQRAEKLEGGTAESRKDCVILPTAYHGCCYPPGYPSQVIRPKVLNLDISLIRFLISASSRMVESLPIRSGMGERILHPHQTRCARTTSFQQPRC